MPTAGHSTAAWRALGAALTARRKQPPPAGLGYPTRRAFVAATPGCPSYSAISAAEKGYKANFGPPMRRHLEVVYQLKRDAIDTYLDAVTAGRPARLAVEDNPSRAELATLLAAHGVTPAALDQALGTLDQVRLGVRQIEKILAVLAEASASADRAAAG